MMSTKFPNRRVNAMKKGVYIFDREYCCTRDGALEMRDTIGPAASDAALALLLNKKLYPYLVVVPTTPPFVKGAKSMFAIATLVSRAHTHAEKCWGHGEYVILYSPALGSRFKAY